MLIDFLLELRARKLPVSTHEWMALMEAMAKGLHESSLDGFYHLCRTLCVKDIALYDAYDEAFLAYFKDVHTDALALTELWDSNQNSTRDSLGVFAKFAVPTVINGKVYVPTFSNQVLVYGLLP